MFARLPRSTFSRCPRLVLFGVSELFSCFRLAWRPFWPRRARSRASAMVVAEDLHALPGGLSTATGLPGLAQQPRADDSWVVSGLPSWQAPFDLNHARPAAVRSSNGVCSVHIEYTVPEQWCSGPDGRVSADAAIPGRRWPPPPPPPPAAAAASQALPSSTTNAFDGSSVPRLRPLRSSHPPLPPPARLSRQPQPLPHRTESKRWCALPLAATFARALCAPALHTLLSAPSAVAPTTFPSSPASLELGLSCACCMCLQA